MLRDLNNVFKFLFFLFAVYCLPFSAKAQSGFELSWRNSTVVLNSGDTLQGPLTLTLPNDIIRVTQANGGVSTFSAVNVKSFVAEGEENSRFFRSDRNALPDLKREYRSLMWNHDRDYSNFRSPAFFIVLQEGPKTLLMREQMERRADNFSPYGTQMGGRRTVEVRVSKFYMLLPDGNIKPLRNPKNDLQAIFPNHAKQITAYAKENKLSYSDPLHLSRMVAYANSL